MESKRRRSAALRRTAGVLAVLAGLLVAGAPALRAQGPVSARNSDARSGKVSVQLPESEVGFPPAPGADIANARCLACHSADMVLSQAARTAAEWQATINKMRIAYGASIPAEQVDALAEYLSTLTSNREATHAGGNQ